jgi:hypothetical protein
VRSIDLERASHSESLVWPFGIELVQEAVEAGLLLEAVHGWRAGYFLLEGEMHSLMAPALCGLPGLMRSMVMPSRSHQTESFERLNKAFGLAKGTPLSERMEWGRPRSQNKRSKAVSARSSGVDSRAS